MRITTEQKNNYKAYLIDCIAEPEEYGVIDDGTTPNRVSKVQNFFKVFNDEYGYEIKKLSIIFCSCFSVASCGILPNSFASSICS